MHIIRRIVGVISVWGHRVWSMAGSFYLSSVYIFLVFVIVFNIFLFFI